MLIRLHRITMIKSMLPKEMMLSNIKQSLHNHLKDYSKMLNLTTLTIVLVLCQVILRKTRFKIRLRSFPGPKVGLHQQKERKIEISVS